MEESKTKPIPLTESELLQLQTGLFDVIEKTDPKWTQSPNTANILYLNEPMIATINMELHPDNFKTLSKVCHQNWILQKWSSKFLFQAQIQFEW